MRKITMTLAATVFVLGSMTLANAQTQVPGASSIQAQAQATTPIHKAACRVGGVAHPDVTGSAAAIVAGALPAGKQRRVAQTDPPRYDEIASSCDRGGSGFCLKQSGVFHGPVHRGRCSAPSSIDDCGINQLLHQPAVGNAGGEWPL